MLRRIRRISPAAAIACLALFLALGGGVYAATKIDGHSIRPGTLPGNRVVAGSLPGNRLKPGSVPANRLAGGLTGAEVDAATLGEVPEAAHARSAEAARTAGSAAFADEAGQARRLNGRVAECSAATRLFAGACWDRVESVDAVSAATAAAGCAERGGELPGALTLAVYAARPDVVIAAGGEWTNEITTYSGQDVFAAAVIQDGGSVTSASSTATRHYRCVFPLVS